MPERVPPAEGDVSDTAGGEGSALAVAAQSSMPMSSMAIDPPEGSVSPKLRPLVVAGISLVTQDACVHVDEAGKSWLVSKNENDPSAESRWNAVKRTGWSDLYQPVIRYLCPGLTVGV